MKRWVAYQRRRGSAAQPLFLVEAESEREALCLASDAALRHHTAAGASGGPWTGPLVHVQLADEAPAADVAQAERKMATAN